MSIPNLFHKIKSKINFDKIILIYLFIIIGVGISAFGLGRLSVESPSLGHFEASSGVNSTIPQKDLTREGEKRYVASKNGKMYYSIGCSGASRIKAENQVWFSTSIDAEKSGFTVASACK